MEQQQLTPGRRPTRDSSENADFLGVFGRKVMPTKLRVLERNGHLLVVKHYGHREKVAAGHLRLFQTLVAMGVDPDGPGTVTVMCLWGNLQSVRTIRVLDGYGDTGEQPATNDSIKAALSKWMTSVKP